MLDVFRGLKNLIKVSSIRIDSPVFRLHYSITVMILIAFSLIITTRQYVGNPIDCVHTKDLPEDVLNTYCWIHSTYTIIGAFKKKVGREVPYPGVDNSKGSDDDKKTYNYYQWVCFCLFFQGLVKWDRSEGPVLWLCSHATSAMLAGGSLVLAARQFVGNPIECDHSKDIPASVLDTWCWIHSTYNVPSSYMKRIGVEVPYPGVDHTRGYKETKVYKFYQWVAFFLFFQAILFYMPRWLWKHWEGGKIHALMMDLDVGICSELEKKQKKKLLLDYLWENLRYHNWWCFRYFLCELLSFLNVIGQMFLMDKFFDGAFLTFGIDVLKFMDDDQEDRVDPMIFIFPRMTKCTFHKFGVSGEVERHDAVCILPLNVVNEKIYIFLWFWFLLLGGITAAFLFYRFIILISPRMRVYLLRLRFRLVRREAIDAIVRRSRMGDWFLLYMLGDNIDSIIFRDVIHELASRLGSAKPLEDP